MDLLIDLRRFSGDTTALPLYKQLACAIRDAIFTGRLKPGQPVPSLRQLSELANVCRATALKAYEDLQRQGLITSDAGRGSFVCNVVDDGCFPDSPGDLGVQDQYMAISRLAGTLCADSIKRPCPSDGIAKTALVKAWKKIAQKQAERLSGSFQNQSSFKNLQRRAHTVMQDYLIRTRAVTARERQMRFSTSNEYLLFLTARALSLSSRRVKIMVGAGSSRAVRAIFQAHGAEIVECPVDSGGLAFESVNEAFANDDEGDLKCIYVNPSHHLSNGVVMPLERRLKLIAFARTAGALIFEDDIESEYRYTKQPLPSIQGLSRGDNVFYLSSIDALLPPPVRVALLVVPERFLSIFEIMSNENDLSPLTMATLADLVEDGHIEVYVKNERKARALLKQKLIYAITRHMLNKASVITQTAANCQVLRVLSPLPTDEIARLANSCGLQLENMNGFYNDDCDRKELSVLLDQIEPDLEDKIAAWSRLLNTA